MKNFTYNYSYENSNKKPALVLFQGNFPFERMIFFVYKFISCIPNQPKSYYGREPHLLFSNIEKNDAQTGIFQYIISKKSSCEN